MPALDVAGEFGRLAMQRVTRQADDAEETWQSLAQALL